MCGLAFVLFNTVIAMATIFSKIVAGEIPSYKVAENEKFYAEHVHKGLPLGMGC